MSNGSMQFLGRQLNIMANALESLVVQMAEAVQGIHDSVPKFAKLSDTMQYSKEWSTNYGSVEEGLSLKSTGLSYKITSYVSGAINIKLWAYGRNNLQILKNGVLYESITENSSIGKNYPIQVEEGDLIELSGTNSMTAAFIHKLELCYDVSPKPSMVLEEGR